ncbi:MAG: peptidoglycan DD-metalloendopeptidase family protein [Candidatus Lariskella arthropodorum]
MQAAFRIDKYHFVLIVIAAISLLYNILPRSAREDLSLLSLVLSEMSYGAGEQEMEELEIDAKDAAKSSKFVVDGFKTTVTLSPGDTMSQILKDIGVTQNSAFLITSAINKVFKLSSIKAGEKVELVAYNEKDEAVTTNGSPNSIFISFQDKKIRVKYNTALQSYIAEVLSIPTTLQKRLVSGVVNSTFLGAARKGGLSGTLAAEFTRMFSYDVDFQRDLENGTKFKILYDVHVNDKGNKVKDGAIQYAALNIKGRLIEIYRYDLVDGKAEYFYKDGSSIRKALLKTPVKSAVISSGYGMRKHPILGYSKVHRGLDYAAPTGTPVFAAGDGIIESVKSHNTYGKYIKIKHSSKYATLYAHLHKFSNTAKVGSKVKQGDIIGYVGATGLATGPHLHYEVHVDGKQVNPSKVSVVRDSVSLDKKQMLTFLARQRTILQIMNDPSYLTVSKSTSSDSLS